jgi:hypothetical protein
MPLDEKDQRFEERHAELSALRPLLAARLLEDGG